MHRTAEPYCWCGINCAHWQLETRKERLAQQTNRISIDREFTMQIHRRVRKSSRKKNYPNKTKQQIESKFKSQIIIIISMLFKMQLAQLTRTHWNGYNLWLAAFQCGICKTKIGRSKCGWTNFDFMKSKTFRSQHLITVRQVNCILDWLLRFRNWLRTTGCPKTIRIQFDIVYHFISFQIEIHVFLWYVWLDGLQLDVFTFSAFRRKTPVFHISPSNVERISASVDSVNSSNQRI